MVPVEFSLKLKRQLHFNPFHSTKESNKRRLKSIIKKQVACQLGKNWVA
jgi:hypothetical protein